MQQILALSRCAVIARHWFEIDLDDASMEHGARIELRELLPQQHRGSESAAQLVTADRPLWRADLFDRLSDRPGSYGVAHFHPGFSGNEPSARAWDAMLTASPWDWLHEQVASAGAASGHGAWPLDEEDASQLSGLADMVVATARQFRPEDCGSAAACFRLTRDVRASVQLMMAYLRRPDRLDEELGRPLAVVIVRVMSRIPYLRREELGPEGQQLWDGIVDGRGDAVVTAEGALAGPFNAFVTAPGAGRRLSSLGAELRFGTSVERRLSEIAIITTGARWQAEFEWWAHAPMAREHGVAAAVVDAIGRGEDPPFEADDERAVYAVARQLGQSGRLDQETYDAAHRFVGDAGMVELVSLCGYYTLISFVLNAFAVPLPPDAAPMWEGS